MHENPEVTHVVYFHADNADPIDVPAENVEIRKYSDAIMYKYFYPLLENIDKHYLLIFDGMLRTLKRNDLTYNCCVHYANQTPHVLAFQYFPMVQDPNDFMILVDLVTRSRYRKQHISDEFIELAEIHPVPVKMEIKKLTPTDAQIDSYEKKKNELFDNIGNHDPNTIPRNLHIWAGTHIKAKEIRQDGTYLARNSRFKKENVYNYKSFIPSADYTIIDFPVRTMQFTDFLEESGAVNLTFLHSGLSVDDVYADRYQTILKEMKDTFYAKTNISD